MTTPSKPEASLRELPPLPPKTCGPETGHVATYTAEQMRAYARAALSRDEAGADWRDLVRRAWEWLDVEAPNDPLTEELYVALVASTRSTHQPTAPVSGEAGAWDSLAIAHLLDERASDRGGDKLLTDAAALIRRLAAVAPAGMDGWQPIETAPKDGADVLVVSQSSRVSVESPLFIQHMTAASAADKEGCWFTHWQPLPTPPATAGKE